MKPIIEVKNIGKKYRITHQRGKYVALRDIIAQSIRHPFAFIKNKALESSGLKKKEEFWALRNITFSLQKGEVVGIIGHNGAGKSTLLKILSQITPPTEGEIILRGRVGSLLEVGTGFHPELTGRENIFLNGAILGMHRYEIAAKFDQIVEFAGIEKFLDTPVKFYSSGMYVRLAFSVAAHMEPDILLVDEVLAVGDAEFQKKCLGKMDEITKQDGRTILFVSHNLAAIKQLCKRCVLIDNGHIIFYGDTDQALAEYNNRHSSVLKPNTGDYNPNRRGSGTLSFTKIEIVDTHGQERNTFTTGETVRFKMHYEIYEEMVGLHANVCIFSSKIRGELLTDARHEVETRLMKKGEKGIITIEIDLTSIRPGEYGLYFWIGDAAATTQGTPVHYDVVDNMIKPLIIKSGNDNGQPATGSFSQPSRVSHIGHLHE